MVWRAVYVVLALTALVHRAREEGTCDEDVCKCVALAPLSKNLTCASECDVMKDNVSVVWNFYKDDGDTNITFRYGLDPVLHAGTSVKTYEGVKVTADGVLDIEPVSAQGHEGHYSCRAVFSNGTQCGRTDEVDVEVIILFGSLTQRPDLHHILDEPAVFGTQKVVCVSGNSPGIDTVGTSWEKANVVTETVIDISSECPSCTECPKDGFDKFLSLPTVRNHTKSHNYSTFVFVTRSAETSGGTDVSRCMDIDNKYVSILIINQVNEEDNGKWEVGVNSLQNSRANADIIIIAEYQKIQSTIEELDEEKTLLAQENGYVVCNSTHAVNLDTQLHWFVHKENDKIRHITNETITTTFDPNTNITISDRVLKQLCSDYRQDDFLGFSMDYAPNRTLYVNSEAHDNAYVQRRYLVLVLCEVSTQHVAIYSCISPATDGTVRREASMQLRVVEVGSGGGLRVDTGAIAGVIVAAFVIVVAMVILLVWGVRRYRLLKYEAMQMRPMSIPLAATQLTNAINQAFSSFSPIGSPMYDKFEFPRENLVLLEVIGEGQFGQVWRARAMGICNEDSRNIVAVKTLKVNHRDSDYFDLRSELDIMRQMEPHPNIINLLGVCSEIESSPLCILMEYAAYGSMKDYLAYCRRVMQAHAEGLVSPTLEEAYPSAAASHGAILRQSMLMGDYPQLQPLAQMEGELGNPYHDDPMVLSRTRRLLLLLKNEGYRPDQVADGTYNHLALRGGDAEELGLSLYDQLYPQSQCVYRPCLEAYNYACYRGVQQDRKHNTEQEYYNSPADAAEAAVGSDGPSPPVSSPLPLSVAEDTVQLIETPPISPRGVKDTSTVAKMPPPLPPHVPNGPKDTTPVRQKTKVGVVLSTPHLSSPEIPLQNIASLSASQDDVFECPENNRPSNLLAPSKEHMRESMISFPDGYIYAPPSTAHGGGSVGEMEEGRGMMVEGEVVQRKEKEPAPPMEDMITYLDMLDFALQIARGVDHLHRMQCVHRDLAARNILISEDFTLKVGDFGLARDLSDKDYYRKVTPGRLPARWMAPESLEERTHTFQSDVWSYGVVLWEILSYGEVPYRGQPEANDCDHLAYYLRSGNRLTPPLNSGDEFRHLMSSCWSLNPDKRPPFNEIMSILDNQLSAAHGYLAMASAPVDRGSMHDPTGSTNPSPRLKKRKAVLQKLDKLQGADRPASLQPGAFSKSKLGKSPSLPIAQPLGASISPSAPPQQPPTTVSPYLLPTPTLTVPISGQLVPPQGAKFGSNPELSLSSKGGTGPHAGVKVNGVASQVTDTKPKSIETQI